MAGETIKKQRSCIGCMSQGTKRSLHRIVRSSEGVVSFDPSGRAQGRGAYVCSRECFAAARKTRKFERALRVKLTDEDYTEIEAALARACDAAAGRIEE